LGHSASRCATVSRRIQGRIDSNYELLKYVHVVSAIVAVGFNLSYGVWLLITARTPEHRLHVLRGIKLLDDRIANPAYILLLITGLGMVGIGGLSLTMVWIAASLGLYVALAVVGIAVFGPALRRQIAVLEVGAPDTAEYAEAARRTTLSGAILVVIALVIVFLMVTKPGF
jgi:uncharacterized membrane protein